MNPELKRQIIMDNYQNPFGKEMPEDEKYIKTNANNVNCIDDIDLYVYFDNDIIQDIKFTGEACAISTSSTSIMINCLMGKTKKEALEVIDNFENMINEKPYDKEILQEAVVYDEIYKQQNRKNCALLPYKGIKNFLEEK